MRKSVLAAGMLFALAAAVTSNAFADVSGLSIRFGGGCVNNNTDGSCTIKVTASGTDLATESVRLYVAHKAGETPVKFSSRLHALDEAGRTSFRLKNVPGGCFQVRTGPNGNDKPDAHSRIKCE